MGAWTVCGACLGMSGPHSWWFFCCVVDVSFPEARVFQTGSAASWASCHPSEVFFIDGRSTHGKVILIPHTWRASRRSTVDDTLVHTVVRSF